MSNIETKETFEDRFSLNNIVFKSVAKAVPRHQENGQILNCKANQIRRKDTLSNRDELMF